MKRYFFVSYAFQNGFGNTTTVTESGEFLNHETFVDHIKKSTISTHVIILNIVELSEQDFNDFNKR